MFLQIRDFVYLAVGPLGTSNKLTADLDVDALRNRLRIWVNAILQQLHSPSFDSDSHDSVSTASRTVWNYIRPIEEQCKLYSTPYRYYSKDKSQIRPQITNKTVVIERFLAIFCSSAFFILRNIILSNYQCANNNDDVPCAVFQVFESEYVKSTSSR